ncbi:hypothetical protein Taro_005058, partial [Colocasia esculenta]|nr:hypothetical protein [Colocasia esculenta]
FFFLLFFSLTALHKLLSPSSILFLSARPCRHRRGCSVAAAARLLLLCFRLRQAGATQVCCVRKRGEGLGIRRPDPFLSSEEEGVAGDARSGDGRIAFERARGISRVITAGGGASWGEERWGRPAPGSGMTRKCSHCSHNGHNSRTCPNRGVKLFGVRLTDGSIRKSASMGNLSHYAGSSSGGGGASPAADGHDGGDGSAADGYASEDFVQGSSSSCRERKKGVPWTEDEHRMFLLGLQKLGKGDWRGIARNFVVSRTPTQVASHAQKYFIRQSNSSRRKRRSSLFDMIPDESLDVSPLFPASCQEETKGDNLLPEAPALDEECEAMDSTNSNDVTASIPDNSQCYPVMFPAYFSPFFPFSFPYWPGYRGERVEKETHEIVKPTAIHSKAPINVEELGISKLSIHESLGETPSLSLKLAEGSDRQSAFHANPSTSSSSVNSSTNPIHAV